MASNANVHLARNFGLMSALVFDENIGNSIYFYRGYKTMRNDYLELKTLAPTDKNVTYGATTDFRIPLYFDKLGPVTLAWDQARLATTGGTYRRFCDWFPLALIEKIEWIYNNNIVHVHYPQKKYLKINKFLSTEQRDAEATCLAGNLSTAQRNTLAASKQEILYEVPLQFTLAPSRYLEIRSLADSPVLRVHWRSLSNVVQTDGTVPVSAVENCRLIMHAIHFEAAERDIQVMTTEKDTGIVRLVEESKLVTRHPTCTIPASLWGGGGAPISTHRVELKNLRTDIRYLAFYIRKKANYDPANLAKNLWYETSELTNAGVDWIKRFRVISGSDEEITPWVSAKYNQFVQHPQYFFAPPGTRIYFVPHCLHPMDELNASKSYNYNAVQDPMLELEFNDFGAGGAGAEALEVEILKSQYNMQQTVKGDHSIQFQHS